MSARILVVDDMLANVRLLQAKLRSEYYTVYTAMDGYEGIEVARKEEPDLILLDVMMPGMDGFETCRQIKAEPALAHIPVVMVTALDQPSDRVKGLEAGADDFLTKPPNDAALMARVRSLTRIKMMIDELRLRDETCRDLGLDSEILDPSEEIMFGSVVVVDDRPMINDAVANVIEGRMGLYFARTKTRDETIKVARSMKPDMFIVNTDLQSYDPLRLCSELRSMPETRHSAVLVLCEHDDYKLIASALNIGANDYVMRPIDENELMARVRTQLLRKKYADRLRDTVHSSLRMAVTDALTELYNLRYAAPHLTAALRKATPEAAPASILLLDIDRFKSINDTHGHAVGDEVLVEFAKRVRASIRNVDLAARIGGEEFLVIMPDTRPEEAGIIAERLREAIAGQPFKVSAPAGEIDVTVSIGISTSRGAAETPDTLRKRADEALYRSKNNGRNRVTFEEPDETTPTVGLAHA